MNCGKEMDSDDGRKGFTGIKARTTTRMPALIWRALVLHGSTYVSLAGRPSPTRYGWGILLIILLLVGGAQTIGLERGNER
ncbi:MAG: hypothetical protein GY832_47265 [Chloroflexi bacterium]|nr:hypothetical protein [Chloroflexota bacterium]